MSRYCGVRDPRIEQAFASVRRESFVGPGPWSISVAGHGYVQTPDDDPAFIYQIRSWRIDAERGSTSASRRCTARCLMPSRCAKRRRCSTSAPGSATIRRSWRTWSCVGTRPCLEIEPNPRPARGGTRGPAVGRDRGALRHRGSSAEGRRHLRQCRHHPAELSWLDALRTGGRLMSLPSQPEASAAC